MISVPEAAPGDEHLRILALLSCKLMDPGFRERLTAEEDESAILGVSGRDPVAVPAMAGPPVAGRLGAHRRTFTANR